MNQEDKKGQVPMNKRIPIYLLTGLSLAIIAAGALFALASLRYGLIFYVLGNPIHGVVFGLPIAYLGLRYFKAVRQLKAEVYKSTSKFSLAHFKK